MNHDFPTHNRLIHDPLHYGTLDTVSSITEAAARYGYDTRYLARLCDMGYIAARKSGGVWLVSLLSLEEYARYRATSPRRRR